MTVGERIRQLREERGLRQTYIAMDLECSPITVWRIEHGMTIPKKYFLIALAYVFNMTYEELMKGVEL